MRMAFSVKIVNLVKISPKSINHPKSNPRWQAIHISIIPSLKEHSRMWELSHHHSYLKTSLGKIVNRIHRILLIFQMADGSVQGVKIIISRVELSVSGAKRLNAVMILMENLCICFCQVTRGTYSETWFVQRLSRLTILLLKTTVRQRELIELIRSIQARKNKQKRVRIKENLGIGHVSNAAIWITHLETPAMFVISRSQPNPLALGEEVEDTPQLVLTMTQRSLCLTCLSSE